MRKFVAILLMLAFTTLTSAAMGDNAAARELLRQYSKEFDTYNAALGLKSTDEEKLLLTQKMYEQFFTLASKNPADFLAKSFAGLTGMRRCTFTGDITRRGRYSFESFGLLDEALKQAEPLFAKDTALLPQMVLVLKNRAEIYSNVPKFFGKAGAAREDAQRALQLALKREAMTSDIDRLILELLLVRARAGAGETQEAKASFIQLQKEVIQKNLTAVLKEDLERTTQKIKDEQ